MPLVELLSNLSDDNSITEIIWPDGIDRQETLQALAGTPIARTRTFSLDSVEEYVIHQTGQGNAFQVLSVADRIAQLFVPVEPTALLASLAEPLRPTEVPAPIDFQLDMSNSAVLAFAAIIDHIRTFYAASLIERRPVQTLAFDEADLRSQVDKGANNDDYRWICAVLPHISPDKNILDVNRLSDGCDELVEAELLTSTMTDQEEVYVPAPTFLALAMHFLNALPVVAFDLQGVRTRKDAKTTALFAAHFLWEAECGARKTSFRCVDGLTAMATIQRHLTVEKVAARPKAKEKSAARKKSAQKPETVNSHPKSCTQCGEKLVSGKKFCTSCGTAVEINS